MYGDNCLEASALLDEVLSKLRFTRFPLPLSVKQNGKPTSERDDLTWSPRIVVTVAVIERTTIAREERKVHMPLRVRWYAMTRAEMIEEYLRTVYTAVRQVVLHELAECAEFDGRLFDDPHGAHPYLLRPERDNRFPPDAVNNPIEPSRYGY